MSDRTFVLIELVLTFGGLLAFAAHQIRAVRARPSDAGSGGAERRELSTPAAPAERAAADACQKRFPKRRP